MGSLVLPAGGWMVQSITALVLWNFGLEAAGFSTIVPEGKSFDARKATTSGQDTRGYAVHE
ncbi:MAG: hypothetical protein K2I92_06755 [Muribaculaceae bacterium]|nr:hypothetical protein [Muribaculaceae bacterium]